MSLHSPARVPMPRAERGRLGSRSRWGPQRWVRLDSLDPVTRDIIRAILVARENAAKADGTPPAGQS